MYDGILRSLVFEEYKMGEEVVSCRGENIGSCGKFSGFGEVLGLILVFR